MIQIANCGLFFLQAFFLMLFWGIIAPHFGIVTISYPMAMLMTLALKLVAGDATIKGDAG